MTEPTPLPIDFICPDGTVPGWLNVDGLPTSCVGDLPLVEPLPEPTRTVDPHTPELIPPIDICGSECVTGQPVVPDELAATGVDVWSAVLVGVLLVAVGGWALWAERGFRRG